MPAERVSMRKIREALRLTHAMGMSRRLVGEATGIGKTAVGQYVRRAAVAGLSWPLPDKIDDAELERRLFSPTAAGSSAARTDPDWSQGSAGSQMALDVEHIVDGGVDREKALCRSGRLEAPHTSFALSQWLMGILCPVILQATGVVTPRNTKFAQRRTVGSELVGDDGGGSDALLLQKFPHELECRLTSRRG